MTPEGENIQGEEAIKGSVLNAQSNVEGSNKTEERDAELIRNEIIEYSEIETDEKSEEEKLELANSNELEIQKQQITEKDKSIEALQKQQITDKDKEIENLRKEILLSSEKYTADRKKVLEEEKQQIIQQQKDSVDDEEFSKLEKRRGEIDKEIYSVPAKTEAKQEPNDPALMTWANNNKWFYEDRVLGNYASAIDAELLAKSPYMSIEDRLDKVKTEVKSRFPEKFGIEPDKINNRRVTAHSNQKVGISLEGDTKTHKFSNLSEEAKKAYIVTCKSDNMSKEQFLKYYHDD